MTPDEEVLRRLLDDAREEVKEQRKEIHYLRNELKRYEMKSRLEGWLNWNRAHSDRA